MGARPQLACEVSNGSCTHPVPVSRGVQGNRGFSHKPASRKRRDRASRLQDVPSRPGGVFVLSEAAGRGRSASVRTFRGAVSPLCLTGLCGHVVAVCVACAPGRGSGQKATSALGLRILAVKPRAPERTLANPSGRFTSDRARPRLPGREVLLEYLAGRFVVRTGWDFRP